MRAFLFISIPLFATAFVPNRFNIAGRTQTKLDASRRDILVKGAALAGVFVVPKVKVVKAFQQQLDDRLTEPTQLPTGGKMDLNSAYVSDYMNLRGMYPNTAGKIASNGPYKSVKDIYKIEGLTDNDLKMMKKYENLFTVNPPGRQFHERINARVST